MNCFPYKRTVSLFLYQVVFLTWGCCHAISTHPAQLLSAAWTPHSSQWTPVFQSVWIVLQEWLSSATEMLQTWWTAAFFWVSPPNTPTNTFQKSFCQLMSPSHSFPNRLFPFLPPVLAAAAHWEFIFIALSTVISLFFDLGMQLLILQMWIHSLFLDA